MAESFVKANEEDTEQINQELALIGEHLAEKITECEHVGFVAYGVGCTIARVLKVPKQTFIDMVEFKISEVEKEKTGVKFEIQPKAKPLKLTSPNKKQEREFMDTLKWLENRPQWLSMSTGSAINLALAMVATHYYTERSRGVSPEKLHKFYLKDFKRQRFS